MLESKKRGLHALICVFSEYQKVLILAGVPELMPNKLQTAFSIAFPLIKSSGGRALVNAERVNTMALPAKSFSTT